MASLAQSIVFGIVLAAVSAPLGLFMARGFTTSRRGALERGFLRLVRSDGETQDWRAYALSLVMFSSGLTLFPALALGPLAEALS